MTFLALTLALMTLAAPPPAPEHVTHLVWDYTNTCSPDLCFQVWQSTNLVDWQPTGISYRLSMSVTSKTDCAFYRVQTLVP